MSYQFSRLNGNGLRLATHVMPHMESVSLGLWTATGSRHEPAEHNGIAHFIEHLVFKGTAQRSALEVSREIERLGASIDAFTVEDHTCYQVKGPSENALSLIEILSDFYQNPNFASDDVEIEREVIHEEILMVRDQPSQLLEDLLSYSAWGSHPLGLPITGTPESLDAIDRDAIRDFHSKGYCGVQTVVTAAGQIDPIKIRDWIGEKFSDLSGGVPIENGPSPTAGPGYIFDARNVEQANLSIAFHAIDRHDERRFALKLLNILLGETMSSRLFQQLREEKGLCYDVGSDVMSFDDAGLLNCYIALDPEKVSVALSTLRDVLQSFITAPPSENQVSDAKSYAIGQGRVALENTSSQMSWMGESLLGHGEIVSPTVVYEKLIAVTPQQIQEIAIEVLRNENLVLAGVASTEVESPLRDFQL